MNHPQRIETVHVETLEGELCIYDWQRMEVHNLNPTAAQVWELCDGQTSPQQMAQQLKGDLTPTQAEELVWVTLRWLENAHLLQAEVGNPIGRKVLSRRELLKGLGVTAALLPVIHSIVAPSPLAAQSPAQPTATATATGTPLPTATPTNTPTPLPIILYQVGGTFQGNLGGRAGADTLCQGSANRPAGYANARAFLSVSDTDEIRDMPANYGVPTTLPIQGPNGTQLASNWANLLDGSIDATLEAAGVASFPGIDWWSGSIFDGSLGVDGNCNGFTSSNGADRSQMGSILNLDDSWIGRNAVFFNCAGDIKVICIAF